MSDFGELSLPVAFYDKWCRSMVDDMKGHLWLASERGLFRFGYDLKEFLRLGVAEGLLGDQISEISIDDSGRLFVVTSQGVFSLDTKVLDAWQHDKRYKVLLYDMRKGDNAMKDSEEYLINDNRRVQLLWNFGCEAFLASPVLFDYANQSGRLYEYRIDNHSWQLLQDGEQLDIHDLMMGSHQLDLRLAGVDGTESTYDIIVVPSLWAILELVLLVVAIVLVWLWWRYKNYTEQVISEHHFTEQALIEEMQEVQNDDVKSEELTKYQKVRIDEAECADIVKRMTEYLDRERVYTNPDLKMKDLADVLHLSAPKLSQVFNIYLGENYYDFINRYRLSEFKRLIDEGENKRYTITALSEQCGFKKSNFFSTFRKVEGMTPAEYLKKHGVTV
jgi:AraC-like DNA-binding protein